MEKIIFFGLAIPILAFVLYLGGTAIMKGFEAANSGFMLASFVRNEKDKEEFKNECEIFSKAAKDIDELLKTTMEERAKWLECQERFEKALRDPSLRRF